jgi:ABC-type multidrug transport system ATPase subunit
MDIELSNIGRRFQRTWIFRNVNFQFPSGSHSIITGSNGSGKSTLLQIISGFLGASEGNVIYTLQGKEVSPDEIPLNVSFAAPYLDLFEDLSLKESIEFHMTFRKSHFPMDTHEFIQLLELTPHENKALRYFSSGMKQRVRLGLAILCESDILLLDEPTSNLDKNAVLWYRNILEKYSQNRTVIVSTNSNTDDYLKTDFELVVNN